jgi:putative endonuclease
MSSASPPGPPVESTRTRGLVVEQLVAELLDREGFVVVARNVAIAGAEIDLIATTHVAREDLVVFVEVRSRADDLLGHPLETIGATKRAHIIRGATAWLVRESLWEKVAVRFDVISVVGKAGDPRPEIVWLRGAFDSSR